MALNKILFVTIAGNSVGYGHLSRCLTLADFSAREYHQSSFLLFSDTLGFMHSRMANYDFMVEPISALKNGAISEFLKISKVFDIAVIDLSRPDLFSSWKAVEKLLLAIRKIARRVVLIDALGDEVFYKNLECFSIDILVIPYVGADNISDPKWSLLRGADYAILSSDYSELPTRTIRRLANRILISCGGSDPKNFSIAILKALELIPSFLEVRIIIGPLFEEDLIRQLMAAPLWSRHELNLIRSPISLAEHMLWCDISIATTGLIKYELAATGTPAILMSVNKMHALVNEPFSRLGSSIDIDIKLPPHEFAARVSTLLIDYNARVAMSDAGKEKIDGFGTRRLMKKILEGAPNE